MEGHTDKIVIWQIALPTEYPDLMMLLYRVRAYFSLNLFESGLSGSYSQIMAIVLLEAYAYECGGWDCYRSLSKSILFEGGYQLTMYPRARRVVAALGQKWGTRPHETILKAIERFADKYNPRQQIKPAA